MTELIPAHGVLPRSRPLALLAGVRPRQWVKNGLVLAAPFAAGEITDRHVLTSALVAAVTFCCCASAVYLINDVADVEEDRAHPTKRLRPVAAGELSPGLAVGTAILLAVTGLALAALWSVALAGVLLTYLVLQIAYALSLRDYRVIDMCVVASGFLLRAIAGGVSAGLPLSQWFLLVAGFGSLFMVAGKRYGELHAAGGDNATRRSLMDYTEGYLRFVFGIAAGTTIMSYSLWAFEDGAADSLPWRTISIAPFVIGLMRYAVDIDAGRAGEPEEIVFGDRVLQVVALLWLVLVALAALHV